MKKIWTTLALICLFAWNSDAQIATGKYMLGGGLNLVVSPAFTTNITAQGGYFLTDNISVGGSLGIGIGGGTAITINPAARYYHNILENTYIFGHAGFGVNSANNTTTIGLDVFPGVAYFLNERFAVEGRLSGMGGGGLGAFLLF